MLNVERKQPARMRSWRFLDADYEELVRIAAKEKTKISKLLRYFVQQGIAEYNRKNKK